MIHQIDVQIQMNEATTVQAIRKTGVILWKGAILCHSYSSGVRWRRWNSLTIIGAAVYMT